MEQIDYAGFLDRLEVAVDRMYYAERYSGKRREHYRNFVHKQIKFLRMQLEQQVF
ncbi:MAG: hypothetical protein AAF518_02490 [Spirochaetota bacterium]